MTHINLNCSESERAGLNPPTSHFNNNNDEIMANTSGDLDAEHVLNNQNIRRESGNFELIVLFYRTCWTSVFILQGHRTQHSIQTQQLLVIKIYLGCFS